MNLVTGVPLLVLPSTILDQSFPRSPGELDEVAVCLGAIQEFLDDRKIRLLITDTMIAMSDDMCWCEPPERCSLLMTIRTFYCHLLAAPNNTVIEVNVDGVQSGSPHPTLDAADQGPLVDIWSHELGKLHSAHAEVRSPDRWFLGVACPKAFADKPKCHYTPPSTPCIPLVDKAGIEQLEGAWEWVVPHDIHLYSASFNDAVAGIRLLGGTVRPPSGGSHYIAEFPGASRPWPIDKNVDPLPDSYIRELEEIRQLPLAVIKTVFREGAFPPTQLRFRNCTCGLTVTRC